MKLSKALCILLAMVFMSEQGLALSSPQGPLGLGAAAMGAAGNGVATARATQALFWNPAALQDLGWDLAYVGGLGGTPDSSHHALALGAELDALSHGGLLIEEQRFASGLAERDLGLAAAVGAGRWFSIGTLQRFRTAEPGGLRGWSMDLGVMGALPLGGPWRLRMGASLQDAYSSLAWGTGLEEIQPSLLRWGLAVEPKPGTWFGFQQDSLDRAGRGGQNQWRLGGQASFYDQRLALRLGLTRPDGALLWGSTGLGFSLPWQGSWYDVDYALLMPLESGPSATLRHMVDLRWHFGVSQNGLGAKLARVLRDPLDGKMILAKIALAPGRQTASRWAFELQNTSGTLLRRYEGEGPLPVSVNWDGHDPSGKRIESSLLNYKMVVLALSGQELSKQGVLRPGAGPGSGGRDLNGLGPGDFGMPNELAPPDGSRPGVRLRGAGLSVAGADFDLAALAGATEGDWQLRIVNSEGKTVRMLQGKGRLPKSLRWEGTDDLGRPVEAGLGASYQLRVTGPEGKEVLRGDDLVTASNLRAARLALRTEARAEQPREICERIDSTGEVLCTFQFGFGSSELDGDAETAVKEALRVAREMHANELKVEGHADSVGEKDMNLQLSQGRADAVLKAILERSDNHFNKALAEGLADLHPVADNASEEGRALNRRAVLRLRERFHEFKK